MLVLAVVKANAVSDLLELVGPADPDLWTASATATASQCLRARFGKSRQALGVRCSRQEATVALELEFLLACAAPGREHRVAQSHNDAHGKSASAGASAAVPASHSKSADVDLRQLLDFLFPRHVQHPNSAGRLFVFGLYGPLDANARLRSGEKGLHVVTDRELATMSARMEREDILRVYRMCSLSQTEEEEVLAQVDAMLKSFPQYTPRDITALFRDLPSVSASCTSSSSMSLSSSSTDARVLSFHAMQECVSSRALLFRWLLQLCASDSGHSCADVAAVVAVFVVALVGVVVAVAVWCDDGAIRCSSSMALPLLLLACTHPHIHTLDT